MSELCKWCEVTESDIRLLTEKLDEFKETPLGMRVKASELGLKIHVVCGATPVILILENAPETIQQFKNWLLENEFRPQYIFIVLSEQQFQAVQSH